MRICKEAARLAVNATHTHAKHYTPLYLHQSHQRPKRLLFSHVQQQHCSDEAHALHVTNLHICVMCNVCVCVLVLVCVILVKG